MDNTNFWLNNQPIAYAVVNGLIGCVSLWSFWTPFITFLAQPVASAVMKQYLCVAINNLQTPAILPSYSKRTGYTLLQTDPQSIQQLNTGTIASLWLLAGLAIAICLWISSSIIEKGQLDIDHIIKLNLIMFVVIITIELAFFVGVGLKYIPFNLKDLYDKLIDNIGSQLSQYD